MGSCASQNANSVVPGTTAIHVTSYDKSLEKFDESFLHDSVSSTNVVVPFIVTTNVAANSKEDKLLSPTQHQLLQKQKQQQQHNNNLTSIATTGSDINDDDEELVLVDIMKEVQGVRGSSAATYSMTPLEYIQAHHISEFFDRVMTELKESQPDDPFAIIAMRATALKLVNTSWHSFERLNSGNYLLGNSSSTQFLPEQPTAFATCRPPPLQIVILIVGSRGDVQPFVALALALQRRGHSVRLSTHVCFRDFVCDNGIDFFPLHGDPAELMRFMSEHPDMLTLSLREIEANKAIMYEIYESAWLACTASVNTDTYLPDIIISNPPVHVHVHIAEKLHIPLHIMFTMPWSPTSDYQHPLASIGAGVLYGNLRSYQVVDEMVWFGCRAQINEFRMKVLGLPSVSNGASLVETLKIPQTYCMSRHLVPKPKDWGPHIDVVGFWFLDQVSTFKPNKKVPQLMDFLDSGPPPLYVGFGSIVIDNPRSLSHRVVEGVRLSGVRAIIHQGWAKLGEDLLSDANIFILKDSVPHDWLFPKCSAVCHHGGAGTIAAGLRCGKPTIVVPFFGDQPFWGACIARMGLGPQPIPHKKLTPTNFKEAILFTQLEHVQMRARTFGVLMEDEAGTEEGVNAFERKLPIIGDGRWECEVWENQRWYPGVGWSGKLLFNERGRHTDVTGTWIRKMDDFKLPTGWHWDGGWLVDAAHGDTSGWEYAISWSCEWHRLGCASDTVRRRRWFRTRSVGVQDKQRRRSSVVLNSRGDHLHPSLISIVYITVNSGRNIRACDLVGGFSDPYVSLAIHRNGEIIQKQRTKIIMRNLNPVWEQTFFFACITGDVLELICWDWDSFSGDDQIGSASLRLDNLNFACPHKVEEILSLGAKNGDLVIEWERFP